MGWEGRCRRHPSHRESSGVCPACLRERLTQISTTSSTVSPPGSSYGSAASSPPSDGPAAPALPRPRSLIFHLTAEERSRQREREARELEMAAAEIRQMKKKSGFWSWLGGGSKKREKEVVVHSRTVREASSTSWPFLS